LGISICFNHDEENADLSIRHNCEFVSNVIVSSDLHDEKQLSHRISTDLGISICFNPGKENADFSIRHQG
jgi:hypothetical protein